MFTTFIHSPVEVLELSPSDGSSGLGGVEMLVMDEMPGWIFDDAEGILTKVKSEMRFGWSVSSGVVQRTKPQ